MSKNFNNNNMFVEHAPMGPAMLADERPEARVGEVYVVEDDPALRRTLQRLLRGAELMTRSYDRASDFLEDAPRLAAGCLVTDLSLPGMDGLELIRRVQAGGLPFSTILITGHADVRLAVEAMRAGASDFIEKPFVGEALLHAVARALKAGPARPRGEDAGDVRWLAALTAREREVLDRVVAGATNKAIARELRISPRTVEVYRASLMRKTGSATLSELVRRALVNGVGQGPRIGNPSGGTWTAPGA